ncbi:tetratricopeptide repeat-containing sensor histidine kinase [Flavobacterium marginilacus]|uniref:tetratricopeptide repeat-containing sensor histidine kinase n=1 Tax=Flavobacterium marginilacus TaxID=3003256 RepID=UPI00248DFE69|nr:tetratricopeptide repeat-containing sensor histidine kinase [Flavobacterium marginilacus]
MKQLTVTPNIKLNDYCHFFRANSFRRKKIFSEAKKEYSYISISFPFVYKIKIGLGAIFLEERNFSKAIICFQEIERSLKNNTFDYDRSSLIHDLGICFMELKKFDKAEKYLFKSVIMYQAKKNNSLLITSYMDIANLYYLQYKDNQAIPYFKKSYDLAKKTNNFDLKRKTAKNMSAVEENRGDYKQALIYRKESEKWKDSLNDQNKVWAVADYEKKYAVAQKQKQISVLKVENKLKETQRKTMFISTLGLLLILVGGVYMYAQKVKNAKIILIQKEKLDKLNATKDQLFSIVSHDLRSSVNALKTSNTKLTASLETKNYNELDHLLHQNSAIANGAYSLLDNLLHWALLQTKQLYFHKDSVHLHSIVQQIEYNYKPLLIDKSIIFENTVSKNNFIFVDLDSLKIILRNLLDNAIKFSPENGKISFYTAETKSGFCQLIIEDNGLGMTQNTINELLQDNDLLAKKSNSEIIGTGLGMQLCKQMIKKNEGTLAIESELGKGTKMILTFPKTV